ncbi:MAG: WcaF family extracellular polysaccharide biosynthesis acetyltransferase [Cyanobacteriota bacterium]|nr:WcaF family extracellular polysaccharide biosynthesis acetyltransferase [Cyanobacteriota bacterium]
MYDIIGVVFQSRRNHSLEGQLQRLERYEKPVGWSEGVPRLIWGIWFVFFSPLLSAHWLPGCAWRVMLLRLFGAEIGCYCRIKPGLRVKFPWRLKVGDYCWLAQDAWIDNQAPVIIGDRVCISQGAYLCTGNHDFRSPNFDLCLGPISIGSEAWIAARAVLAPGTVIGPGAVVALGAVVSGTVPARAIMRGNPAVQVGDR